MKKIKFLCLTLVLSLMVALCFVGCSNGGNPQNPTRFSVTFSAENSVHGSVSATTDDGNAISSGETLTINLQIILTATPNEGYSFIGWFENGTKVSDNSQTTVTITKNISYQARFSVNKYNLNFISENADKGSVSGNGGEINYNEEITLIATANSGYSFDGWYENATKVSFLATYTFNMPARELNLVAKFIPASYDLVVASEDENKGIVSNNSGLAQYGQSVTVTATPNNGYSFDGWYENSTKVSNENSYTFTMPANSYSLVAKFTVNFYQLNLTSENTLKGSVSNNGGNKAYNEQITVIATANNGYSFDGWYENSTKVSNENSYTFTMPANSYSLVAKFSVNSYTLNFASENTSQGTVSSDGMTSPASVNYGEQVIITATPKTGYSFDGWYENSTKISDESSYTFTMPFNDYDITAKFKINSHVFNFSTENQEMGSVVADNALQTGASVEYNTLIGITAVANTGYEFDGWYLDDNKIEEAEEYYSFKMPDYNYTLVAKFSPKKFTFNFTVDENGSVQSSVNSGENIDFNSNISLTATPNEGYSFGGWYDGATKISDESDFSLKMPAKNYTIQAKFKVNSYLLTFVSENTSAGTVSGNLLSGNEVEFNKTVKLTALPKAGYSFDGWYIDNQKIDSAGVEYEFLMPAKAYSLTAKFTVNSYILTVESENEIMGMVEANSGLTAFGLSVTVIALPNTGYEFDGWYDVSDGDEIWLSDSIENTFNMPAYNYSVVAKFAPKKFVLAFSSEDIDKGTVSATNAGNQILSGANIEFGAECTLKADEKTGYDFLGWYVGDEEISSLTSYTFTMPNKDYTLVAKFVAEKRTVIFYDGNVVLHTQELDYKTALSSLENLSDFNELNKDGYVFLGWTTERNGDTTYNLSSLVLESFNLYAKWQKTTVYYSVEFRYEDNSVEFSTSIEENSKLTQIPAAKQIDGFEFSRWYYFDSNGQKQTFDKETFEVISETVIYAEYSILTFDITFNADNGSESVKVSVDYNQTVARPTPPTKEGYDFIDWFVGDAKFEFDTPITENLTLVAKWQEVVPDSFKVNFYNEKNGELVHTVTVIDGEYVSIPTGVNKLGHKLDGWYYIVNDEEKVFSNQTQVTSNLEVYAKFSKLTFNVSFVGYDEYGILGSLDEQTVAFEESAAAPSIPQRVGYTFKGWDKSFDSITEDITVNAVYEIITYTVTYMDGMNQIGEAVTVNYGDKLSVPSNPEKTKFAFVGWYTTSEFDVVFNFAQTAIVSDTIIYAKFTQEIFTVTFNGYNSAVLSVQEIRKGESAQEPSAPNVEGFSFDGWDKEFSNVNSDITITAVYTQIFYTVSFVDKDGVLITSQSVAYGDFASDVAPNVEDIPTVDNMVFIGWDKNIEAYIIKEDTTFRATYEFEKRTVNFFLKENDVTPYATIEVYYGSGINLPNTPPQENNLIFEYWYTTDETVSFDPNMPITENLSLYAKYKEIGDSLTVKFVAPDGVTLVGNVQLVQNGGYAIEPAPYDVGYIWCLSDTTTPFDFDTPITENTVFIAVKIN